MSDRAASTDGESESTGEDGDATDARTGSTGGRTGSPDARVGVVGGGITGLALTYYLRERGVDAVAFEAAPEPGGVVRSERRDGTVLEHGPQRVRLSGPLATLVDDLGLDVVEADDLPVYVYARGALREAPTSLRAFLRTDALSWRGKLRVLGEPLTDPGSPDETAAELFARKFGPEAYRNVIGPLFGGTFGSDPARMPARHALSGLLALERREGSLLKPAVKRLARSSDRPPAAVIEGGNQRLPEALCEAAGDRVRLETPVEAVREDGGGYLIETAAGETAVDRVVVTAPADATADLLEPVAPDAADRLADLRYNPLALVYLRAAAPTAGFGYQVRRDEPLDTLGVSWNGVAFGRDDLATAFLGGMGGEDVLSNPDDRLAETAAREYETVTGLPAEPIGVERLDRGFPAYDESWAALEGLDLPEGITLATNYTDRMGVPSRVRQAKRLATDLAG